MTLKSIILVTALFALPLTACVEETANTGSGAPPPTLVNRADGLTEVAFNSGCTVLYNRSGKVVNKGSTCSKGQMKRAREAFKANTAEQDPATYADV